VPAAVLDVSLVTRMSIRVLVSAGEVSGDQHLARVLSALKGIAPDAEVRGMAGPECRDAGAYLDVDCYRAGATMGFFELFRSARSIFSSFSTMKRLVAEWRPHVVVLVDYPGFNLRLAKVAHEAGAKVLYFIPPKVWAWKAGRVKTMRRYVDHVAAIFPFEPSFLGARGFSSVTYVGHPLADIAGQPTNPDSRPSSLLLLPGSRRFEVERLLPPMLRVFERLRLQRRDLSATVLVAPNMNREWLQSLAAGVVSTEVLERIEWKVGDALHEAASAQVGILKSGTCNLEGALALLPFVSVYSGSWLSKVIVSTLVPLKEYSPVNIVRSGTVSELMQVTINEDLLYRTVEQLLEKGDVRTRVVEGLRDVRERLLSVTSSNGAATVAARVAQLITEIAHGSVGAREVH
jgi:lipid-A-disaccharide synthase